MTNQPRYESQVLAHLGLVAGMFDELGIGEDGLRQQLALYHAYYNFCLPHARLRQPLAELVPTNGTGSAKSFTRNQQVHDPAFGRCG